MSNGALMATLFSLWQQGWLLNPFAPMNSLVVDTVQVSDVDQRAGGQRQRLTYQQWVEILDQEAQAMEMIEPEHLTVLLGDSLSLWFDRRNIRADWAWLNQGISGEKTLGLLHRLEVLDGTQPKVIFLMIGINDLLWDVNDETVVANYQLIVEQLQRQHPQAQIVIQSILPHGGDRATWEGRARFKQVPNERIQRINRQLEAIAATQNAHYLDLYSLFLDDRGNLDMALSTDGLHLNEQGYQVWAAALQLFTQLELDLPS